MSASYDPRRARVFGTFADDYDRWQPGYPVEAVDWLVPPHATAVADVGAGTGKLTGLLLGRGLVVTAVEPDDAAMLDVLNRKWLKVVSICAPAEQLPLGDASVDVVLVGQAWYWFDHARAVREVRRVLRPGGWLGLVGNGPGIRQPWQERLEALSPDAAGGLQEDHEVQGNPWAHLGLADLPYQLRRFPWRESITPAAPRARIATQSRTHLCQKASSDNVWTSCPPSPKPKPTGTDETTSFSNTPQYAFAYRCEADPAVSRTGGFVT